MKNTTFVEPNTKNIFANLSPMFHMVSEEMIFLRYSFFFFCTLVTMATIKIRTGLQNRLPGRGPFKEHFYKSFVKISVMA